MNCHYCEMDSGGSHQPSCPNSPNRRHSPMGQFIDLISQDDRDRDREMKDRPEQTLIEEYITLLSAFAMTSDAVELTGETIGTGRLMKVALFIQEVLSRKVDEIIAFQEASDDYDTDITEDDRFEEDDSD